MFNKSHKYEEVEEELFEKPPKKRKKIKSILIFILIITISILIILATLWTINWQNIAKEMMQNKTSIVLDSSNNIISEIGSGKIYENTSIEIIPNNLRNAYVSIEDQRFYTHSGVDLKRTLGAIFSYVTQGGNSSFGGSTITQQLVKNITGDDSAKISRKIKEWFKAWTLEACTSKDEILEAYLNIIYVGPNIYGVNSASTYYFNKNLSDLSLAECAFLAGINNSPNSYNPFGDTDNSEKIKKRTKIVLNKMFELKYINQEELDSAILEVDNGLKFSRGSFSNTGSNIYSYHTDALISELISKISKKKYISSDFSQNYLSMAGLTIYSTQNTEIQTTLEKEFTKSKYILSSNNSSDVTSQAAMVVLDNSSGYVSAVVGSLGEKSDSRGLNRATQSKRQTGSAIKPIAVLVPAISTKIVTNATLINDELTIFNDGSDIGYTPTNYNDYLGTITLRRAVESSQNIPFVKIMEEQTPKTSIKHLKQMGITTLTEKDENLALALGGLDIGMIPLEVAAAYATIANDGIYKSPIFYTKVNNSNGKTIIESKQKKRNVFSKNVAYILKKLLTQPVTRK